MAKAAAKSANLPDNFEQGLAELEALIAQMEAGGQALDASLLAFSRGTELLRFCESKLSAAEQQVRLLEGGELKPMPKMGTE
ncbi:MULTISPECIES: exodeoxyribonuclease VII small subunit [Deefgea]|uniref:Exodeoxyribonuclease 7 small subunit n=1 Tax=Deefgea piscis TaxID=2739061 RepID=A0A6M8ST64_9NEIS|nr:MULTISPECIES: exodeoxyribonuclease VII small subunit [Deefgea]MBM5573158.1 exodeoxyribonuclease VII small subunit [Deefgea sp. CFH1-16]QKJ67324.1 exodeoxyribonuclease VII small subunit [Deefgea piscis]QZA82570.1 exodeoxyribonuclease VII small subunit [Deefgea piscis]